MLLIHSQFAARTPKNIRMLAESKRDLLQIRDSKVPGQAFGAVLKGIYSEVEGGVGKIEVLNRDAAVME